MVTVDVVVGTGVPAGAVVVCMCLRERWAQGIHEYVCVGSMLKEGDVGRLHGRVRCRVPYWLDASPWRRTESRVTAERLRNK